MAEDISYRLSVVFGNTPYELPQKHLQSQLLDEQSFIFSKNNQSLVTFNITPQCVPMDKECVNRLLAEKMRYARDILLSESLSSHSKLNNQAEGAYFVSGHGDTGKTFSVELL